MEKLFTHIQNLWEEDARYRELHSKEDLLRIKDLLYSNKYAFRPMYRYWIPKSGGRLRPITQPDPSDLLLLSSLFRFLRDHFEPKFYCSSHGFRPKRGYISFFNEMRSWSSLVMLQKSDVVSCFDNIPHNLLLTQLRSCLDAENEQVISLIESFLRTPILDKEGVNYASSSLGIPQGSPISPVLMNIYLHSLDARMDKLIAEGLLLYVRYADDIILGFQNIANIPRLTRVFAGTLKNLGLQVKSEKIRHQEKRRSSAMRVLGMICCITPNGQISARAPFEKWEKKLSVARIKDKMEETDAPKTLAIFFLFMLSIIKPYLYFFFGCRCAQTDRKIYSFFQSLLRRRSLEFLRGYNPSDGKAYRTLLAQYERKLLSRVVKTRKRMRK